MGKLPVINRCATGGVRREIIPAGIWTRGPGSTRARSGPGASGRGLRRVPGPFWLRTGCEPEPENQIAG
jgi:hypothetical protein